MSDSRRQTTPARSRPPSRRRRRGAPARSLWRLLGRTVRRVLMFAAILLAVAFVTTLTVDLGPGVRGMAERAGANYLKRDFTIGRLSIRLLTGRFVVEDLRIGGLEKGHRPFLVAKSHRRRRWTSARWPIARC